ncbi:MAG: CDP-glycerol glycerophosphotransferase family protein [Lachnospiraceae bacterium]|nr:CDP-glycerol glycerophosphotransferase family protein [Lachnospiraceae bacterium]
MMTMLYIDPGTGSMLFTILIGILGTCVYLLRNVWVKLRFTLSGGAKEKQAEQDRIPFAVFSDSKRYWNQFEPICDEFERREQPLIYMTASPDDPALKKEYKYVKCSFIGEGNRAFAHLNFLKADILLSTTPGLDVYQWKRSRDVKWYVHIPHASNDIVLYRMFGLDYYDAVLLSGEYQIAQIRELEERRHLPAKEMLTVGMPYMDAVKARLDAAPPLEAHETTVLLAPSWGSSGILSRYGADIIRALLATGYHVVVRPHPQSFTAEKDLMDKLMKEFPNSDRLEWNRDNDNFEVLRRSDILISDFSGVIFDYALVFGRPVIYADTSFDKSPYDACWLDEELWTFTTLPKIGKKLSPEMFPEMKSLIDGMLNDPQYREAIETAKAETWEHIGESAALTADYLIRKRESLCAEAEK